MDIGEFKRTTIVKPQSIPVPQRDVHREVEQPQEVPSEPVKVNE